MKLHDVSINLFDILLEEFKTCLDNFPPLNKKKNRFNNSTFMTKGLRSQR